MSRELADARLLTMDGSGHTELDNPSGCVGQYEAGDVIDGTFIDGTLAPLRTVCQPDQQPFPAGQP
jgi:hypothetical protein